MTVLLITNKADITTDFIVSELTMRGIRFYRLNTEDIGDSVQLNINIENESYWLYDTLLDRKLNLADIASVYFRRPEIKSDFPNTNHAERLFLQRELAVSLETIYGLLSRAKWLNTIEAIRKAENKVYQLLVAKQIGFTIPPALVTNTPDIALEFYKQWDKKCIIKPLRHGLIKEGDDETIIFTSKVLLDDDSFDRVSPCPVYIQKHIQKQADVRVTVVGENVFAAMIHSQENIESQVDWRRSQYPLPHTEIQLPEEISSLCVNYLKKMNLRFGAIDFVLDQNSTYIFLEINPNGQWAWIERQLGFPIAKTITDLLIEKNIISY
jgi:glutathione synthase/RimK-type ligase-like ATP-grasp enzyme